MERITNHLSKPIQDTNRVWFDPNKMQKSYSIRIQASKEFKSWIKNHGIFQRRLIDWIIGNSMLKAEFFFFFFYLNCSVFSVRSKTDRTKGSIVTVQTIHVTFTFVGICMDFALNKKTCLQKWSKPWWPLLFFVLSNRIIFFIGTFHHSNFIS